MTNQSTSVMFRQELTAPKGQKELTKSKSNYLRQAVK